MPVNLGATYFLQDKGDEGFEGTHAMFIFSVDRDTEEYICLDSQRFGQSSNATKRVSWSYDDDYGNKQKTQIFLLQITNLHGFKWKLSDVELFRSERVKDIDINGAGHTEGFNTRLRDQNNQKYEAESYEESKINREKQQLEQKNKNLQKQVEELLKYKQEKEE